MEELFLVRYNENEILEVSIFPEGTVIALGSDFINISTKSILLTQFEALGIGNIDALRNFISYSEQFNLANRR